MIVHYSRKTKPSALLLQAQIKPYDGLNINWGIGIDPEGLNRPEAIKRASNKRIALQTMREAGIPTPEVWLNEPQYPCVGRRDHHAHGSGFFMCDSLADYQRTLRFKRPPTHYLEFINGCREFRIHVVGGKSIKLLEKISDNLVRSYRNGTRCVYPRDFHHKKTLRGLATGAIQSLGLDFGAVDVLYKDGTFYVLECNTAPDLKNNPDTLERYAESFTGLSRGF